MNLRDKGPEALLEIVQRFADESHPQGKRFRAVTLDSSLEKDLGLDSLSRVELLSRIEQAFDISLPEQTLTMVETPRDLLQTILSADSTVRKIPPAELRELPLGAVDNLPIQAETLLDVLDQHVHAHPDRSHITLYGEGDKEEEITYGDLMEGAEAIAAGLIEADLQPGRCVAIMLPTGRDYLYCFFGILVAGGVPVPLYPPARLSQIEDHLRRHAAILKNALTSILITLPQAQSVARFLKAHVEELKKILTPEELLKTRGQGYRPALKAEETAFIQYTSGSTGTPKGVVLSHANLLANIRAMGEAVKADSKDVFVSWLPLYHDMGLIGAWLGSLYYAMHLVLMSPLAFLKRPERWLWAIHRHRGTLSAGPNFAYELCLKKIADPEIEGLDLGSWRLALNGAEQISPETLLRFQGRFEKYGFRPEVMTPVYGLAESSVGLAFPPPQRGPRIDKVQREPLERTGRAVPAERDDESALSIVSCGYPLSGHEIRIVDARGRELGEREQGRLQFKGPSATTGYFRNPEESRRLLLGDWLDSGDLAYIAGGEVYLTGRSKDIIIRAGRNIYPYELEEAVSAIPGIRKGCVAVFGSTDPASGTERFVVLAETRETEERGLEKLRGEIVALSVDLIGAPPDDVVLAPPHTVLKTSSGKIRRSASRELYELGKIGKGPQPVWRQFLKLAWSGVVPSLRRTKRNAIDLLYALYAWTLFACLAPIAWTAVYLIPIFSWRYGFLRATAKALLFLSRTPCTTQGLHHLRLDRHCVLVANHASYIDNPLLVAVLPRHFSFVAKGELLNHFISRLFLRRMRTEFVERFDHKRGVLDAQQVSRVVRQGRSVFFFPEGTFHRMPGLHPFHMGAFVAAAEAGVPVIPTAIRGTRSLLRAGSWFLRRSAVSVTFCAPIYPEGSGWDAAIKLRDATRAAILKHCGEPDLA